MIIKIDNGVCGSGKTTRALDRMGSVPSLYVYAVDRRDVMATRAEQIAAAAAFAGMRAPYIRMVKSARDRENVRSDETRRVRQDLARIPDDLPHGCNHAIIIITHEALKGCSWDAFAGWNLIIDEVPNLWDHEERQTPAHVAHFQAHYDLQRIEGTAFSMVTAKPGGLTLMDLQNDATASTWSTFHKRVQSDHGVYTDIHDWREMALPDAKWSWYSLWDVHELSPFAAVTMMGNAFEQSVTYHLINSLFANPKNPDHKVEFVFDSSASRATAWAPRKVRVLYVAKDHVAGSSKWTDDKSPYRDHQHKWADWVAASTTAEGHYWSANKVNLTAWKGKIPGEPVSSKIAGSNDYRDMTTCSVCYSAKGRPMEISALKLFAIEPEVITRSREMEDLIQIVLRSSLRMPDDFRDVELRVYDHAQANFIAGYFNSAGFPFDVDLVHVDIGLDDVARKTRKEHELDRALASCMTDEQRAFAIKWAAMTKTEKVAYKRAEKRKADEAAGKVIRSRGRPRKAA